MNDDGGFILIFRALRSRNYRLFFGGQLISLIGTWMQQVALTWLVYRLTNSAFLLGIVGFASQLPTFVMSSFAGVIADRLNRHRIIVVTQALSMLQAIILAGLTLAGKITVGEIIALSTFLGVINAFDIPTRQSFLLEMVDRKEDLPNAIALNSSMFNGARLVGPAIAGLVIALLGEGLCFLVNAVSYIAVIAALLAMKLPHRAPEPRAPQKVWEGLREGLRYALGSTPIRNILLLIALVSMMGMPYAVLMPVVAKDILGGGAHTLGFLVSSTGLGALLGALILAWRKNILGLTRWIAASCALFGVGLVFFALSRELWLSMMLLFVVGVGMMVQMASSNTILQTIVDDDKRGRVMSFYTMSFMGMIPFGSLIAGTLAGVIGVQATLLLSGAVCIIGAGIFAWQLPGLRREVRPIYIRLGILKEASSAVGTVSQMTVPPEN